MELSRYRDLFLAEVHDHLSEADRILTTLDASPRDGVAVDELFRRVHSMKGMAATMGYDDMVTVSHAMEDLLEVIRSADWPGAVVGQTTMLWEALACLARITESIHRERPGRDGQAAPLSRRLRQTAASLREAIVAGTARPPEDPPAADPQAPASPSTPARLWRVDALISGEPIHGVATGVRLVRRLGRLGEVVRFTPPLSGALPDGNPNLLSLVIRSRRQERQIKRDLQALSGLAAFSLAPETVGPTPVVHDSPPARYVRVGAPLLEALTAATTEIVVSHERLAASLPENASPEFRRQAERARLLAKQIHQTVMAVRMVPFETVSHRLTVGVHELSRRLGKRVRFSIEGGTVRLDRAVLEALVDPLLHIVRNAIDHGVEDLEARIERGKPGPGWIRIRLSRLHDRVRIVVQDDGRGLDPDRLRRAAVQAGRIDPSDAERLSDSEAFLLVTLPGLSTSERADTVSGRGVGMDVVRDAVERLGGGIGIESESGLGTSFVLELPVAVAVIQSLLVRLDGELFAIPIAAIERTLDLPPDALTSKEGRLVLDDGAEGLDVHHLGERLAPGSSSDPRQAAAVLLPVDRPGVAVAVDRIVGRREILVRPLEPPLDVMPEFTGATLLEDGSIALVVDPGVLSRPAGLSRDGSR